MRDPSDGLLHAPPLVSRAPRPAWYVLYLRCHHENKVASHLAYRHYHILLPKRRIWSRRKDRRAIIEVPVFPGYLFIEGPGTPQSFLEFIRVPGVCYVLGYNGLPSRLPEDEIDTIRILVEQQCDMRPHAYFTEGERVRVVSGPLKGCVGVLEQVDAAERQLVVGVDLLQRSVSVELAEGDVEKY